MKTLSILALAAISTLATAQSPWSLGANYTFSDHKVATVAANKFDTFWRKDKLSLDAFAFGGGTGEDTVVGGSLGFTWQAHERLSVSLGLSISKRGQSFEEFFKDFNFKAGIQGTIWYTFPMGG